MHNPKDKDERTSISLDVRSSTFEAQPSFGQMPLFHTAARLTLDSLSDGGMVRFLPLRKWEPSTSRGLKLFLLQLLQESILITWA